MRRVGLVIALVLGLIGASCGSRTGGIDTTLNISAPTSTGGDPKVAGEAITMFGEALFAAARGDTNAVVSPVSVAIALGMLEPAANGSGKTEIDTALHIADPAAFHASMTALRESLMTAKAEKHGDYDPGDLQIAIANATYLQQGLAVLPAYIDALSTYYGPALNVVDFAHETQGVVDNINDFIAEGTRHKIPKLLNDLDPSTVLALVNALYLKASWLEPFDAGDTQTERFTRRDGSTVKTSLMHGVSDTSTRGAGWVAARKAYSARLAADFVLPDDGKFDEVAARLGTIFPQLDANAAEGSTFVLPKLTTRFNTELKPAFNALGIKAVYDTGNLMGLANTPDIVVDKAIHATFLAMDEEGTEAAAATVITARAVSARGGTPVPVILDQPFFFRIVDFVTGATLFIGQVLDPTAS